MCLFRPLCKNDDEEGAIRGFNDNQHASKESQQQTTRVDATVFKQKRISEIAC